MLTRRFALVGIDSALVFAKFPGPYILIVSGFDISVSKFLGISLSAASKINRGKPVEDTPFPSISDWFL